MCNPEKNRENNARRKLSRRGYLLRKSRTGSVITVNGVSNILADDQGGYMIVDARMNTIAAGERFDLSLEDVERFIAE